MNILFITPWYPTEAHPHAGVFVQEHARAVAATGAVDLRVLHVKPGRGNGLYGVEKVRKEDPEQGFEVEHAYLQSLLPPLFYYVWPPMVRLIEHRIQQMVHDGFKPDLVHANVVYPAGLAARRTLEKQDIPYVLTEHWSKVGWLCSRPFYRQAGRKAYQGARMIMPVSEALQQTINSCADGGLPMEVVPNVVDRELFRYKPRPRTSEGLQLLCVTNFHLRRPRDKRPEMLLEALERLEEKHQNRVSLHLVGEGENLAHCRQMAEESGWSEQVSFHGFLPKQVIAGMISDMDYLLHPTERETFGVVVAEALSAGLPCAVSDIPALRELVDSSCGMTVDNTVESWAEQLKKLIENPPSFDRKAIAEKQGTRFSPETVGRRYLDIYRRVLGQR